MSLAFLMLLSTGLSLGCITPHPPAMAPSEQASGWQEIYGMPDVMAL